MIKIASFKNTILLQKKKLIWIIFTVIGISTLPPPITIVGPTLDASGLIALSWIKLKDLQVGHDIIFTFGPLGYLYTTSYVEPFTWLQSMLYGLFVHSFFIFIIALFMVKLPVKWKDNLLVFLLIPTLSYITSHLVDLDDQLALSLTILLYLIITNKVGRRYEVPLLIFTSLLLAIDSLIKLNMAVSSWSIITMYSLISIVKKEYKMALVISASYIFFVLALWIASGQHLINLPSYFMNGLEISSGYTYGMAGDGPRYQLIEGLTGVIFVIILLIYSLIKRIKNLSIFILLNGGLLFESFKHGFVRQDLHVLYYFFIFGVFFFSAYIIYKYDTEHITRNKKRTILLTVLFLGSILCVINVDFLLPDLILPDISKTIPPWSQVIPLTFDKSYQIHMTNDLKNNSKNYFQLNENIIQYIDNKSVDIFPWDIALPWAYDMNWSPRPLWQSFTIFTHHLDELNAQHFMNEKEAPQTILYSYKSIDGRYPLFDEPVTLATILHNYQYVNSSGEFALLSYNPQKHKWGTEEDLGTVEGEIGKPIQLPKYNSGYIFADFDLKYSHWGKFMNEVYKPALAHMRFKLSDQSYSPDFRLQRISNEGVLVSEYVDNSSNMTSIFSGKLVHNVDGIVVFVDDPRQYEKNFQVKFVGVSTNSSIQESKEKQVPNWSLLKSIPGGAMSIDWFGNKPYGQNGNIIDVKDMGLQFIDITGWAVDDTDKDGTVNTFLVFQDGEKKVVIPTQKVSRPDLVQVFGVDSYRYSGWRTTIYTKEFEHGCYTFSLYIPRSNGQEYFDISGGKSICFD